MTTIGDTILWLIDSSNQTQGQFAEQIGTSRCSINQLIQGRRRLTIDMALKIEDSTGASARNLLKAQFQDDLTEMERKRLEL